MSTVGQWVGGIVGAVIGYYTIGVAQGAAIGMALGGALDPPKGPHMEGPRLSDLSVQTSAYGVPIPRFKGKIATYGNVFWVKGNKIDETVTEDGGGKGGGGPTSTSYSYSATFAVGLGEGPVTGIGRIWIRSKLVYDGTSLDPATISAGLSTDQFTFYPGSDTQMPDPTIQADRGVANTPAYRGLAYIVFKNLPLAEFSNSLAGAQVKVEVISAGGSTTVFVNQDFISTTLNPTRMILNGNFLYSLQQATDTLLVTNVSDYGALFNYPGVTTRDAPNSFVRMGDYLFVLTDYWTPEIQVFNIGNPANPIAVATKATGNGPIGIAISGYYLYVVTYYGYVQVFDASNPYDIQLIGSVSGAFWSTCPCVDNKGYLYVPGYSSAYLKVYTAAAFGSPTLITTIATYGTTHASCVDGDYLYLVSADQDRVNVFNISDPYNPTSEGYFSTGDYPTDIAIFNNRAYIPCQGNQTGVREVQVFDITTPSAVIKVGNISTSSMGAYSVVTDGKGNVIVGVGGGGMYGIQSYFFAEGRSTTTDTTLATIVSQECLMSNLLTAGDIDVTELTDVVRGYKISNVAAIRASLETLRGAYPFDVVQHGYKLKFKRRGSASVATIQADQLDARGEGENPGVRITNSREMDSILPCRVTLKHFDIEREYDQGEQFAERINTDAINVSSIEMPLAFTPTEAAQKADMLLYIYWIERYDVSITLPPTYQNLEPADCITIVDEDATYNLRLLSISYLQDGRLECNAKYSSTTVYSPEAVGESGLETGVSIINPGATVYELLDIPTISDSYSMAGFPLSMSGFLSGWPGGVLFRSSDLQTWAPVQGTTTPGGKIGFAYNSLAANQGGLIDKAGYLSVKIYQGVLSSITEAQMLNGGNHFAYGIDGRWEIIAAQNCVLQQDGAYILTDFLRGRFGTEWATGLHVDGDHLVYLNASYLSFISMDINSIGAQRYYRGITVGKDLSADADKSFAYSGVNLECLSPIYLNGNRTSNDWNLAWIRRTRVGGEWRDLVDATLGETTESYEIDIYSDGTYTVLKRTISSITTSATYTSAQQITDFGSNQSTLYLKIYQLSSVVGRGYPLTTSITR